jgi:hypothetical protein
VSWLVLGYATVFGTGVFGWSFALPRMRICSAMRLSLSVMLPVCLGLLAINHSAHAAAPVRWSITASTALLIMVESGFTPAALAWLAQSLRPGSGKGAAMGIYSVLLSVGAIGGSLLAGVLGKMLSVDGLLLGRAALAVGALLLLHNAMDIAIQPNEESYDHAWIRPCDTRGWNLRTHCRGFRRSAWGTNALIDKGSIGGDCTLSGCVPSKSLIKVASVAHHARTAARYGIGVSAPTTDMTQVRAYLHATIRQIYEPTMPEALRKKGMDVLIGAVRFLDPHTLEVGTERICARKVLINTGTKPRIPAISGLANVLYLTYNRSLRTTAYLIFDRGANFNEEAIDTVKSFGIQPRRTSVRSPWQNGVAKRWVGNCRRNCSTM